MPGRSRRTGSARARIEAFLRQTTISRGVFVSRYPPPDSLSRLLRDALRQLSVDCVLDVGGFDGRYVQRLRKEIGFRGPVVSFEPAPDSFERMTALLRQDPNWRGLRMALGNHNGKAVLHRFSSPDFNSVLLASEFGRDRFRRDLDQVGEETVDVRRLDDVFEEVTAGSTAARVFLKLDTQGLDMQVIEGALPVIDRVVGIQTEIPVRQIYEEMPTFTGVVDRLAHLGFESVGFFPVGRDATLLRATEFDCVLIRPDRLTTDLPG